MSLYGIGSQNSLRILTKNVAHQSIPYRPKAFKINTDINGEPIKSLMYKITKSKIFITGPKQIQGHAG